MVSTPSPPPPPNPYDTAQAQGQMNKETAVAQARLNATNQVTPYGNLTYTAGPEVNGVPQYTATQTLSPEEQALFNQSVSTQKTLGEIGGQQAQKVQGILNTPFDLNSNINTQQADIGRSLLDPVWQQRQNQLEQQLANQGITPGSQAYTNAMRDFGMQRDNSYNSMLLADRGQAAQEALTQRNQPLNEISALMSGSQVQQPNFVNTPNTGIAPTDLIGAVNSSYQGQLAGYNANLQNQSAMMGGLFGLAAAPLGGWAYGGFKGLSEPELKKDKEKIGQIHGGPGLYAFRYKGEPGNTPKHIGMMAPEVQKHYPEAVERPIKGGPRIVDYRKVAKALVHG